MAATTGNRQDPKRVSMLTYGLLFGPAMGMLVALTIFEGEALALGLALGAAAGVVIGVLLDARHNRRRPE